MEPITTAAIASFVYYLGKTLLSKSFETTVQELTKDGLKWVKSIFHRDDGSPKDVLSQLKEDPDSEYNIQMAELEVKRALSKNPEGNAIIEEMYEAIKRKEAAGEFQNIVRSKNVNTGSVSTGGGDFIQGDGASKLMGGININRLTAGRNISLSINHEDPEGKGRPNDESKADKM